MRHGASLTFDPTSPRCSSIFISLGYKRNWQGIKALDNYFFFERRILGVVFQLFLCPFFLFFSFFLFELGSSSVKEREKDRELTLNESSRNLCFGKLTFKELFKL